MIRKDFSASEVHLHCGIRLQNRTSCSVILNLTNSMSLVIKSMNFVSFVNSMTFVIFYELFRFRVVLWLLWTLTRTFNDMITFMNYLIVWKKNSMVVVFRLMVVVCKSIRPRKRFWIQESWLHCIRLLVNWLRRLKLCLRTFLSFDTFTDGYEFPLEIGGKSWLHSPNDERNFPQNL